MSSNQKRNYMEDGVTLVVNEDLKKIRHHFDEIKTRQAVSGIFKEKSHKLKYIEATSQKTCVPWGLKHPPSIFQVVEYAYSNHLSLEFVPDDWLHAINFKISRDIKTISEEEEESGNKEIRNMFVDHEGQKKLTVERNDTNYLEFIKTVADLIKKDIKIPELAAAMKSDFKTSTSIDKSVSSISLANAMSNFYKYELVTKCGIRNVTLKGSEEDWKALLEKVKSMKMILQGPLTKLGYNIWFNNLEKITENLLKTYQSAHKGEEVMADWWRHIFTLERRNGSGANTIYNGWIFDLANIHLPYAGSLMTNGMLGEPFSKVDFVHINTINGTKGEMKICGGIVGYDIKDETVSLVKAVAVYQNGIEKI